MPVESERFVGVERAETGVATVTLDRPKLNGVCPELIDELLDTVDKLATESDVRTILLKGAGRKFCAGADIAVTSNHTRETYRAMRCWSTPRTRSDGSASRSSARSRSSRSAGARRSLSPETCA